MNNNYLVSYVDTNGKVSIRHIFDRIRVIVFAGFKIIFDRLMSLLGLIILSPLMIIICIAIKLDSKGPIFFRQVRTGKNGKPFKMYKFRTMVADNDMYDLSKNDEFTRVGKILRRTSLDEIPQLINILVAQMSFIGPRPWIPDYFENMNETQRVRYCVRPGLTGLAQANGRNAITIFDKINYDLEYIKNYSFSQDLKVIILTIKAVFTARGADAGKGGIDKDIRDLKKQNGKGN